MQKTILIAEDHADLRQMAKFMVESFGYSVVEARDGFEALEEAKAVRPDLILMDIAMPLMNGITAAAMIRRQAGFEKVPIVAITAYGEEYSDDGDSFGFDDVLEKPFYLEDIASVLKQYFGPGH